jgi:protein-disulfide isomerase
MKVAFKSLGLIAITVAAVGCAPNASQVKKVLEENPSILFSAIEKDPEGFMMTIQKAQAAARAKMQENAEKEEMARQEAEAKHPLKPKLSPDRASKGSKTAPITIVEYSDFQCPFCGQGYATLQEVLEAYPGKIHFVFKNLPLTSMHPMAMPAAKRFEAIAMQSPALAYKFHNEVFENQETLNDKGEKFLDSVAKKIGANVARMKKDMESDKVRERIQDDMREAQSFGIQGTPGFVINGVSLRGAYPFPAFKEIIDKQLAKK